MAKDDYLTEKDEDLLDALGKYENLKYVSKKLDIAYSTARVRLANIRRKKTKSINTWNRLIVRSRNNPRLSTLLTPMKRTPLKIESEGGDNEID